MSNAIEVREKHKNTLYDLLDLKKQNPDTVVIGLQSKIDRAVAIMEQEDVALVEKIIGIKAL